MSLTGLLQHKLTQHALATIGAATSETQVSAPPGLWPVLIAAQATAAEKSPLVAVTATGRSAEDLSRALRHLLPPECVHDFPSWETLPHERLSPRSDTIGRRIAALYRLAHPEPGADPRRILVAPVRALLQPMVAGLADRAPVRLQATDEAELEAVVQQLATAAYTRVDLVERRGEFAVRGGILDVFAPTDEHPVRVEFWGDTVEQIRWFSVADQRSLEVAPGGLWAPPCRELQLTSAVRERAAELIPRMPGVADLLTKIADGHAVEGMEALTPALADAMELLTDRLPPGARILVCDPERVHGRAHDLLATSAEFLAAGWSNASAGNAIPVDLADTLGTASFHDLTSVREQALAVGHSWLGLGAFSADQDTPTVAAVEPHPYGGQTELALTDVAKWAAQGWQVALVTEGHGLAQRMVEVLGEQDVPAALSAELAPWPVGVVQVTTGSLLAGFVSAEHRVALLTETDLTGTRGQSSTKDMRRMPARRRNVVDPLQLRPGDFVVHEQHGVGRFVEMMQRVVQGATREYLVIEYAPSKRGHPGDRLFVPSDALDQVTKYVGGESPSLNKLGGGDWEKTKSRARKAVKEIAGELVRLYSARMASPGHAFASDSPWQRELEDAFAYVETPDQLSSIQEVKTDMERAVPMDRLICGDVGYGKTEIAVRAAFKAVQDGKQVAVLVPTTLLVQQHFQTFVERYAGFPVVVKALSRFQSTKESQEALDGIRSGAVDVLIGTHRILTPQVRFKDLGLIIVDEEQRFGVEHKEQLKAMRTAVDVLAMSATPIPRTLEMAVTGIREMSTLATPPEERHPVLTFVGAYDEKQIVAALRRELLREGQVFFVHNRVSSIERAAARLRELVPEARVATAHGQMGEHKLEQVVVDFWEKKFDVLVCTTIVETGLDISNANTLIVERADVLGLSQLHQLRGRVGRGRERAYSYFLYPPEKPLTETALDRLRTIAQHTDLGSGMAVAMKDLEIRGAGNLLGGEQSGHIAGVGFDLYIRLVGEAVANYRGQAEPVPTEMKVELPVDAHLPHDYIPGERLRLEAYKKLADASDEAALGSVRAELADRYGEPPLPVQQLLAVAQLRILARRAGLTEITTQGSQVKFAPVELRESQQLRLNRLYPGAQIRPAIRAVTVPKPMTARVGGQPLRDGQVLDWVQDLIAAVLLDDIAPAARVAAGG